jgi:hypothetical protein
MRHISTPALPSFQHLTLRIAGVDGLVLVVVVVDWFVVGQQIAVVPLYQFSNRKLLSLASESLKSDINFKIFFGDELDLKSTKITEKIDRIRVF